MVVEQQLGSNIGWWDSRMNNASLISLGEEFREIKMRVIREVSLGSSKLLVKRFL